MEDTFIVIGGSLLNHGGYVQLIRSSDWQLKFFHGSGKARFFFRRGSFVERTKSFKSGQWESNQKSSEGYKSHQACQPRVSQVRRPL